jgi:hypothetical protein
MKNGQSREHDNIGYTRRRKPNQEHNTICVGHYNAQTRRTKRRLYAEIVKDITIRKNEILLFITEAYWGQIFLFFIF